MSLYIWKLGIQMCANCCKLPVPPFFKRLGLEWCTWQLTKIRGDFYACVLKHFRLIRKSVSVNNGRYSVLPVLLRMIRYTGNGGIVLKNVCYATHGKRNELAIITWFWTIKQKSIVESSPMTLKFHPIIRRHRHPCRSLLRRVHYRYWL